MTSTPATSTDRDLLDAYATRGDQDAFAQIVHRYADLVYSSALRQVGSAHAEDVSQAVFLILSRKARHINGHTLAGWLVNATRLAGMATHRMELRRFRRQQKAAAMKPESIDPRKDADQRQWNEISPLLDDALARLHEADRTALTLRFFQGKSVREIADAMNLSEAAAGKRTTRAIAKLREYFARAGVNLTSDGLGTALAVHGIVAAPLALSAKLTAAATATAAVPTGIAAIANGVTVMTAAAKVKIAALVAAAIVLTTGTAAYVVTHTSKAQSPSASLSTQSNVKVIQAVVRTDPSIPLLLPATQEAQAPEMLTRYTTPEGEQATFSGRVEGLLTSAGAGAEIGLIYLRGTHWLTTNNYQWQPVNPDGTFTISAQRYPESTRALAVRAKGQSITFLRAEFPSDQSRRDIVVRMKPAKRVTLAVKNSRGTSVGSFKVEVFNAHSWVDDEDRNLHMQRLDAPNGTGGKLALDLPLEPVALLLSGTGIAPYYQIIDPRDADQFEFRMISAARIKGKITTASGEPAANVRVLLINQAAPLSAVIRKTDSQGHFQLTEGVPGTYSIRFNGQDVSLDVSPGETKEISLDLNGTQTSDSSR